MVILKQDSPTVLEEIRVNAQWLSDLDHAMARACVPASRREGCKAALLGFLMRFQGRAANLEDPEMTAYISEQAEAGLGARTLLDLLEALTFFFESVLPRHELALRAG